MYEEEFNVYAKKYKACTEDTGLSRYERRKDNAGMSCWICYSCGLVQSRERENDKDQRSVRSRRLKKSGK